MSSRAAVASPEVMPSLARQSVLPLVLFCLGHFLVDLYSGALGAHGLALNAWGALPGVLVSLLLLAWMPKLGTRAHALPKRQWDDLRAVWKPLTILYFLVFIRSVVQVTFTQFLPLYLHTGRN